MTVDYAHKFREAPIRELLKAVLLKYKRMQYNGSTSLAREICDEIRQKLKEKALPRYKMFVHATVGEIRGQGIKMGNRCFWDAETDACVTESVKSETQYVVATVYGVYQY
jgi:tctex1 domain-containing protein 2